MRAHHPGGTYAVDVSSLMSSGPSHSPASSRARRLTRRARRRSPPSNIVTVSESGAPSVAASSGIEGGGDAMPAEPGFYRETFELLALQVIDIISQLLQSLNLLTGANPLSGLTDGLGLTGNITNPLTNGGGGSVNIQ